MSLDPSLEGDSKTSTLEVVNSPNQVRSSSLYFTNTFAKCFPRDLNQTKTVTDQQDVRFYRMLPRQIASLFPHRMPIEYNKILLWFRWDHLYSR